MRPFSAFDCLRYGWDTFKRRGWFFVGTTILMFMASLLIGGITSQFGNRDVPGLIHGILDFVLSTFVSMGYIALMLRAHDSVESAEIRDLWHPEPFVSFLVAELFMGVLIFAGIVLFIVPGLIAILWFLFTPYIIIDKEKGPIEAMKESMRITKGARLELLLLILISLALNVIGAIAIFVGLLITTPITMLALVHAYRTLSQEVPFAQARDALTS